MISDLQFCQQLLLNRLSVDQFCRCTFTLLHNIYHNEIGEWDVNEEHNTNVTSCDSNLKTYCFLGQSNNLVPETALQMSVLADVGLWYIQKEKKPKACGSRKNEKDAKQATACRQVGDNQ